MNNNVQLCTYVDRLGMGNLATLTQVLNGHLKGVFGAAHLLPFYYPIDGADAGFDPIDHTKVDQRLGDWGHVATLSESHDVMVDVIVNHVSSQSAAFKDYLKNGDASPYKDLFLTFGKVFPQGATEQQLVDLYRPRPGLPFTKVKFADDTERMLWTTFTSDQMDIDVFSPSGKSYLKSILTELEGAKVKMIRLDAAGYAVKKAGSRCFMTDDTFEFIEQFTKDARAMGMEVLVEIHAHYLTQVAIAKKADWVYDFALPPLVLHTLTAGDSAPLQAWYDISPRNAVTVLDTHDGIGIIDVAQEKSVGPGLLSDQQVDDLVESIHTNSQGQSRKATGEAASNVDLYQVNCTFYDALARDDNNYLLARLIQFFSPGVPQVYYVGLFAGENDMQLLQDRGVGRDINRHYYSEKEIATALKKPVVQYLIHLIKFRNNQSIFNDGEFAVVHTKSCELCLSWSTKSGTLQLLVDLEKRTFNVEQASGGAVVQSWSQWSDF